MASLDHGPGVRRRALRDTLQAAYARLGCESSSHKGDGYLTHEQALAVVDGQARVLELLCSQVLDGEPPMLHRPKDSCPVRHCIDASGPWRQGFDYRLCGFAKRNPTRAEKERKDAQAADARDKALKTFVLQRDVACRYCRSGPLKRIPGNVQGERRKLTTYDHVDPDRPGTPPGGDYGSNFVVACARCNERKGHNLPHEVGMVLLPEPTPEQVSHWHERGVRLFDLDDAPERDAAEREALSKSAEQVGSKSAGSPQGSPTATSSPWPSRTSSLPTTAPNSTGEVCPEPGAGQASKSADDDGKGAGRVGSGGRLGTTGTDSLGQPFRTPDAPDIYHRRSRPPPTHDPPDPPSTTRR